MNFQGIIVVFPTKHFDWSFYVLSTVWLYSE